MPQDKRDDSTGGRPGSAVAANNRAEFGVRDVVASYDRAASDLVPEYEGVSFEQVHAPVLDLLPESAASVLDVGAGTGRDAAWFADHGHGVVAMEPSSALRAAGTVRHDSPRIRWIDDRLPGIQKILRPQLSFDLIWLSAVWMHVPRSARTRAFRKLVSVLSAGGSMMVSLRLGPPPPGRPMEPATAAEIEALARQHGLQTVRVASHRFLSAQRCLLGNRLAAAHRSGFRPHSNGRGVRPDSNGSGFRPHSNGRGDMTSTLPGRQRMDYSTAVDGLPCTGDAEP